jgi:hypothetical protein
MKEFLHILDRLTQYFTDGECEEVACIIFVVQQRAVLPYEELDDLSASLAFAKLSSIAWKAESWIHPSYEKKSRRLRDLASARGFCAPLSVDRAHGQLCAGVAIGSRTTDSFAVPGRPVFGSRRSTDMTKAEADEIQLKWTQQDNPPLCEHRKVELEQTEGGDVSGTYRCTACGQVVPG